MASTDIDQKPALSNPEPQGNAEKQSSTTVPGDEAPRPPPTGNEDVVTVAEEDDKEREKQDNGGIIDYFMIMYNCSASILTAIVWALSFTSWPSRTSISSGAALPLTTGADGSITLQEFRGDVDDFVLWLVYLFVGRFVNEEDDLASQVRP
ncbi:uncharacterized protein Z518_03493 [Rhinocladiella mackenziei CBS 650.93]|uniref:Uncharacterized protein n=1 Tax=Rhinocladiella mackenziei CBS 650.93 TaxID=1442369 RepID=A0A0D2IZI4_9EURO|nr:uncharacterized protein Z518_03493 [Rhinocladiella mackenziei CBS 650.93]KIX08836.1 hypothetical protein Z518_03493 [Rhinocladiella mackenziei CBS 650.93]